MSIMRGYDLIDYGRRYFASNGQLLYNDVASRIFFFACITSLSQIHGLILFVQTSAHLLCAHRLILRPCRCAVLACEKIFVEANQITQS